jgi:hypothetical protein
VPLFCATMSILTGELSSCEIVVRNISRSDTTGHVERGTGHRNWSRGWGMEVHVLTTSLIVESTRQ